MDLSNHFIFHNKETIQAEKSEIRIEIKMNNKRK